MVSHLRHSRGLEKTGDLDLEMHDIAYAGQGMGGPKRVSAQCEEVIVDTDPFGLQDCRPDVGELLLERRSRRGEGLWSGAPAREPQLRRQPDTFHFTGWALRQLRDDQHLARDFEIGDAADGELTYGFRRCHVIPP